MDRLPPELLTFIISYLPAHEILKCKQINSEWRSIIDNNIRLKNLVITDQNLVFPKWSFTYQLVNCYDWIKQFHSDGELIFKNLNQLYIKGECNNIPISLYISNDQLNSLNQLKRLELYDLAIEEKSLVLNLPNLTYLAFKHIWLKSSELKIVLNTPKLSHLKMRYYSDRIVFNYPSSIKFLELEFLFDFLHSKVIEFPNLEYFYCERIEDIDQNFLNKLPNLKEFHFSEYKFILFEDLAYQSLKRQSENLRIGLKVFYYGMNLVDLPDNEPKKMTDFLYENYDKLVEVVPLTKRIEYDVLEYRFGLIPINFTSKFVDIQNLSVCKKLNDKRQFIEFLKSYRNLKELSLKNSSLNQNFINILPALLPNLKLLTMNDKKIIFNFKPIPKLKQLYSFETNQNFEDLEDLDFVDDLFKKTKVNFLPLVYRNKKLCLSRGDEVYRISTKYPKDKFFFNSNVNFHENLKEFERSNLWKRLPSRNKSNEKMDIDYEPDDENVYKLVEIPSDDSNTITQF